MSSRAVAPAGSSELAWARGREHAAYLSIRLLAAAAIAFVVVTSFQARPFPGGHGEALGVAVSLIAFCGATIAVMWLTRSAAVQLPLLLVAVISAAALIAAQGNGAAFLGVFPAVCMAGLILSLWCSALVAGVAAGAVTAAWLVSGGASARGIVLNDFGIVAFYLLSLFARRLRESNLRAEALLAELEQTRSAQARAAALAERQHLAREMHDVLAHTLSGLALNLESAILLARQAGTDPRLGEAVGRAHKLARSGLDDARRAIGMLRDDALPGPGRLADLAAEFSADTGVPCRVTVAGDSDRDLGGDGRMTIYRVTQEALTNIRRHARADRIEIGLTYEPSGTKLTIQDFDSCPDLPKPAAATGFGLTGMRERAELLGGTFTAGPNHAGFLVELWVPA